MYIRVPGVDVDRFAESMRGGGGGLLGYIDQLSGGSISKVGLFSLGEECLAITSPLETEERKSCQVGTVSPPALPEVTRHCILPDRPSAAAASARPRGEVLRVSSDKNSSRKHVPNFRTGAEVRAPPAVAQASCRTSMRPSSCSCWPACSPR